MPIMCRESFGYLCTKLFCILHAMQSQPVILSTSARMRKKWESVKYSISEREAWKTFFPQSTNKTKHNLISEPYFHFTHYKPFNKI